MRLIDDFIAQRIMDLGEGATHKDGVSVDGDGLHAAVDNARRVEGSEFGYECGVSSPDDAATLWHQGRIRCTQVWLCLVIEFYKADSEQDCQTCDYSGGSLYGGVRASCRKVGRAGACFNRSRSLFHVKSLCFPCVVLAARCRLA